MSDELNELASAFAQQAMNAWTAKDLPQEPMARALVLHGALMISAIVGAQQCAAELREMADQLDLGQAPAQGRG
jgi:hypothetical protein